MREKHSVCVVTHPLSEASETAVHGLLDVIAASAAVSLVTTNLTADSAIRDDYEVVDVASSGTGDSVIVAALRFIRNQFRMAQIVRRRDEEVVLFFGAVSYLIPILVARVLGRSIIVEPRGNVPESLYRVWRSRIPDPIAYLLSRCVWGLERAGYSLAHGVVSLSPSMADDLGLRRYEHKLHEHGARPVNLDRFSPSVPYEERPDRIGYLGRLDEEKGVDVLIDVVQKLAGDVEFVFIGDGALRPEIETRLESEIEAGTVSITGWVDHDEVPAHLAELRLLVSTSPTEGVPTTALEAMACGTPVAAFPVGGIPDVVADGETGVLLEDQNPAAVATTIQATLEQRSALAEMSREARGFVASEYSFDTVARRYDRIVAAATEK